MAMFAPASKIDAHFAGLQERLAGVGLRLRPDTCGIYVHSNDREHPNVKALMASHNLNMTSRPITHMIERPLRTPSASVSPSSAPRSAMPNTGWRGS